MLGKSGTGPQARDPGGAEVAWSPPCAGRRRDPWAWLSQAKEPLEHWGYPANGCRDCFVLKEAWLSSLAYCFGD